jgi:3-oxoacyl-[acyl-carrier protein] reductase
MKMSGINLKKVAVVTGGTKGIGQGIVLELASRGFLVYALGRNLPEMNDYASDSSLVENIRFAQCDVSSFDEVQNVFSEIVKEAGRIDVLVNNAGITKDGLLMRMKETDWDAVMNINLKGTFNTAKAVARTMMGQRSGRIINIGSVVGTTGNAGQSNYSASKAGLVGFTKSLAGELGSRNILVNLIAPGYIQTDMTAKLNEEQLASFVNNIPLKRAGLPQDIARVVAFFAGDDSGYVTGQVIHVDGGLAM